MSDERKRALVVAMVDSIHVARWLELFRYSGIDFQIVSSSPNRRIHPRITALTANVGSSTYKVHWFSKYLSLPAWLLDRVFEDGIRARVISSTIRKFRPHFVHAIEFQNAGYATAKAYKNLPSVGRPKLLVTNYGSDIFWFQNQPKHLIKIRNLLNMADGYSAECKRDVALALRLGFNGDNHHVFPNSAGLDALDLYSLAEGQEPRSTIAIKGYQSEFGQALSALSIVESMADELLGFDIELFSCNRRTIRRARRVAKDTGLELTCHPKHKLSHGDILSLFRRSILYIGLSKSDGISTSMLEAMSQGAVPIQTGTACANEWIENGKTGFIVSPSANEQVSQGIRTIIRDASFRHYAITKNLETIRANYLSKDIRILATRFYASVND